MLSKFLHRVTHFGLHEVTDRFEYQRVLLTNTLTLVVVGFSLMLLVITIVFQLYVHSIITIGTILLVLPVLWFNYRRRHILASFYLVHFIGLTIFFSSYIAFALGRVTETENWIYSLLAISVFLFDNRRMVFHFVWFFMLICVVKWVKYETLGWSLDTDFYLLLINVAILCLALFVFLVIFKIGFRRAITGLEEANRSKNKLFSIIAHDIRSPLALFESLLYVGKMGSLTQEEFQRQQIHLKERLKPLNETINDLLVWSQANLESIQPNPSKFSPLEKFREVEAAMKPLAESKRIDVYTNCAIDQVYMDAEHFKIILRNIYHNALKFTSEEGKVTFVGHEAGAWAHIKIVDTGHGMTIQEITDLKKGKLLTSRSGTLGETGTGLGLSLSMELVRKNGGRLDIWSEEGRGTTFTIKIPNMVSLR